MLTDIKIKLLGGLLLLSLLGLLWYQYQLNKELRLDLNEAKTELKNINDKIILSNTLQESFNEKIQGLEIVQYNQQQELKKKLTTLKSKPAEEQTIEISNTYVGILTCIEKTSLGEQCEQ